MIAQVVPSGPGYQRENGQELMVDLLYTAARRVVITTPYFVPDEPFLQPSAPRCCAGCRWTWFCPNTRTNWSPALIAAILLRGIA